MSMTPNVQPLARVANKLSTSNGEKQTTSCKRRYKNSRRTFNRLVNKIEENEKNPDLSVQVKDWKRECREYEAKLEAKRKEYEAKLEAERKGSKLEAERKEAKLEAERKEAKLEQGDCPLC